MKAEFITKQEIAATKIKILSEKYGTVRNKLIEISEKFRTKCLLIANQEKKSAKERLLKMFDSKEDDMNEFVLKLSEEIRAKMEN
jgi:hypothetical protein